VKRRHGIAGIAVAALVVAASAGAEETKLAGTVGPGFSITLKTPDGADVKSLQPGAVEIEVKDLSEEHNFHLSGPGVDLTTGVETTGDTTFRTTLADGRYRFVCDVHPSRMAGTSGRARRRRPRHRRLRRPRRRRPRRSAPASP
jgi:plastocyanin